MIAELRAEVRTKKQQGRAKASKRGGERTRRKEPEPEPEAAAIVSKALHINMEERERCVRK